MYIPCHHSHFFRAESDATKTNSLPPDWITQVGCGKNKEASLHPSWFNCGWPLSSQINPKPDRSDKPIRTNLPSFCTLYRWSLLAATEKLRLGDPEHQNREKRERHGSQHVMFSGDVQAGGAYVWIVCHCNITSMLEAFRLT